MKKTLSYLIVAALFIWPATHMALSKKYGFSSWRLGGFGMYATPHPDHPFTGILVILDRTEGGEPSWDSFRRVPILLGGSERSDFFQYYSSLEIWLSPPSASLPEALSLGSVEELRRLRSLAKSIRHIRRTEDVRGLAEILDRRFSDSPNNSLFIILWTRRLDLKGLLYTEGDLYHYRNDSLTKRGRVSSRDQRLPDFLRSL